MLIQLNFLENMAIVRKEDKDKKIYRDSELFHKIKRELQALGFDCIKKERVKDGHLVSEGEYYIRDRKWEWWIFNPDYQIQAAYQDYNEGKVTLRLEW
jgi:hypothetical protein